MSGLFDFYELKNPGFTISVGMGVVGYYLHGIHLGSVRNKPVLDPPPGYKQFLLDVSTTEIHKFMETIRESAEVATCTAEMIRTRNFLRWYRNRQPTIQEEDDWGVGYLGDVGFLETHLAIIYQDGVGQ